ncbi:hypothetical protein WIW90_05955 [Sulfolobaceae archaeon RB850M]
MSFDLMCNSPIGLGGMFQTFPFNGSLFSLINPISGFLGNFGFQVFPFMGQNLGVIQTIHPSLFSMYPNIGYTIRLCQGPGFLGVETGHAGLLSSILGGSTFDDFSLHNSLLSSLGIIGGLTPYSGLVPESSLFSLIASLL